LSSSPKDVTGGLFSNLAGQLKFVSNKITLDNSSDKFNVSVATIVVRKMIFADGVTYDPTKNQWSFTDHLGSSSQMFGQTATLLPTGGIHLLGGRSCSGSTCSALTANGDDGSVLPQLAAFSKLGASMGSPRVNETATPLPDGKVLLAGGSDGTSVLSSSELYDPVARTFSQTGSLHEARDFHTATLLINGRVLVTGGFSTDSVSTGSTNSAELYDPASGAWTETSPLPVAVDHQTATLLPNGDVLVAGGSSNGAPQSAAEIYISTTGTWQPLPDMPVARSQHSATLLQDGRVLLAGGVNATGVLCSAVLYDPNAAGDWVTDRDIGSPGCSPVHSHSATLLKDGSVLLAGGNDGFGEVDHSWRYTPSAGDAQGTWSQAGVLSVKRSKHDAL
ncbi:MAG: hypothetical protein KGK30_09675, partial [Elusimicrobia bacterium]|nr:hypothetical protein [Elusimicrobiota bacterium]